MDEKNNTGEASKDNDEEINRAQNQAADKLSEKSNISSTSKITRTKIGFVIVVILIALLTIVVLFSAKKQEPNKTPANLSQALNSGDFVTAQKEAQQALTKDPNNKYLLNGLINGITSQGSQTGTEKEALVKAQPFIDKVMKENSTDRDSLLSAGYAYEAAGQYEKALTYYDKAIALDPKYALSYFRKGHVLAFLNRVSDSQAMYDKAKAIDPNNPQILILTGQQLAAIGKFQESAESFKTAAETKGLDNVTKAEAFAGAAFSQGALGNINQNNQGALALSKQAVDSDAKNSPALSVYAYSLYLTGDTKNAIEYAKKAINANLRISKNYIDIATFYRTNHDYKRALAYCNLAISLAENDNTLVSVSDRNSAIGRYDYELARTLSLSGSQTNVISLLKEAIGLNPTIKSLLVSDVGYPYFFKGLSGNTELQKLIQ